MMLNGLSIDELTDWLSKAREVDPASPLGDLISSAFSDGTVDLTDVLPADRLLDLACIDLISRRRAGFPQSIECLWKQFPLLRSDGPTLDLVDAEICVRRELESDWSINLQIADYTERFPTLASEIKDLILLSDGPNDAMRSLAESSPVVVRPGCTMNGAPKPADCTDVAIGGASQQFSISPIESDAINGAEGAGVVPPVDVPDWFIGSQCVANGPGHWLVRGRDAERGVPFAMKIIRLPLKISSSDADRLLTDCERAARVTNPTWVTPKIAAVQHGCLAVVRPWEFGNAWKANESSESLAPRLKSLASVAFALQAAHNEGAAHGGVHANNLLKDHHNQPRLVDSMSSRVAIEAWLRAGESAFDVLQHADVQSLLKLILAETIDVPGPWSDGFTRKLQAIAAEHKKDACGQIGDEVLRRAEMTGRSRKGGSASLRRRLINWLESR